MDPGIYIAVLGVIFLVLIIYFVRQIWSPRKLDSIFTMLQSGMYKKAIRECQVILEKNERNHTAHFLLGKAYFLSNQMEQALLEFKYLTKINKYSDNSKEEDVRNYLAEIFLHFGQLEEAQKEFLLISRINPADFEVFFKIAKIFYERNYLENAYAYFLKSLNINNKHAESHYYLGLILYHTKKLSESVVHFNQAIQYDKMMYKANYYVGMIYKTNNNYNQAIQCFTNASRDPEFTQKSRLAKGLCFLESNDLNKAVIEFEQGLKDSIEEDNITLAIRYNLASCYEKMRDLSSAIEQWEKIANYKPNYSDVLEKLSIYQELRTDDHLKDFLTASNQIFEKICRDLVLSMGFDIAKFSSKSGNMVTIIATDAEGKWRNTKKSNRLIYILRENMPISEQLIRSIQEEMKTVNANRAICITSTKFSPVAQEFAAARPIDLIEKEGLADLLKKL